MGIELTLKLSWSRNDAGTLNRVQFETRRFQFRPSPSGRPWKAGTMGFKRTRFRCLFRTAGGLKSYSFSLVIGLDEDHPSLFQSCPDHCSTSPVRFMLAVLESAHCAATDASTFGEFFLGPVE